MFEIIKYLNNGKMPMSPIYKAGNNKLVTNYRLITKQSALPKLLEKLMIPTLTFTFNIILDNN
jgi:hypothetical protein